MSEFTFLTVEQYRRLEILRKRGTIAPITDFSILLGGYYNEDRSGFYWTSSDDDNNGVRCIYINGKIQNIIANERSNGARPALPYSSIRDISSTGVIGRDGILEVEYGEYPQKVASKSLQRALERALNYNQSLIRKTGKTYTIDSITQDEDEKFSAQIIEEYLYDGKK